ncbi:sulfatase [Arenibacter palladensis]|uniref:sulfatase n=1 Tax=Arenibacter palladensis TaxID=237373 RepID=UPI0026E356A9|nr:sulfatase [Arenibacter palladensis]MDO6604416.1 sulfatase [Arenibacter palladensis]
MNCTLNSPSIFFGKAFKISFFAFFLLIAGCKNDKKGKEKELVAHPNVLFISLDDMNDWIRPLAGSSQTITPNLDKFAENSVNFTKNYCPSPGCNPSRSAVLTGVHTYNSGMYSNYQDWRKVPKLSNTLTLGQYFNNNGYRTVGAGKIFHYQQVDTLGWDDYYPSIKKPMPDDPFPEKTPVNMKPFEHMYSMFDWSGLSVDDKDMGDYKTVDFISEQLGKEQDKPFFFAAGIYRPHLPWYVPQKYYDMFPLDEIELPNLMEGDTTDLGPFAKELISRGGNYHKHVTEADQWKKAIQGYLASVAFSDAMVGRLLEALEQSPYADNTIVVLWSDHGWQLGEKNHWRKFALWENVIRSVLMVKVPKHLEKMPNGSKNGVATTNLTSLMDIYPTLVDLCNLPDKEDMDGVSLRPILQDPEKEVKRPIITTYDYGSYSVRYQNWHLIDYIDGYSELYNLENDPEEWYNLDKVDSLLAVKSKLRSFIPADPVAFPESSLIPLGKHHIPPIRSKEHYESTERKQRMERFNGSK